jgi:SAP domain-containing ribonucleoprotein
MSENLDIESLKVADLVRELKALGKKTTGLKKQELVDSLKAALAESEQKQEELDGEEVQYEETGEQEQETGEQEQETGEQEQEAGEQEQEAGEHEEEAGEQEGVAESEKNEETKKRLKRLGLNVNLTEDSLKKENRAKRFGIDTKTKTTSKSEREARFGTFSEDTKKKQRAERFGTLDEQTKRSQRAEKFGTVDEQTKKLKRAQKFGLVDEGIKKKQRSERFGTQDESTKKRQRAEKFGTAIPKHEAFKKQRLEKFGANRAPIGGSSDFKNEDRQKRQDRFKSAVSAHLS